MCVERFLRRTHLIRVEALSALLIVLLAISHFLPERLYSSKWLLPTFTMYFVLSTQGIGADETRPFPRVDVLGVGGAGCTKNNQNSESDLFSAGKSQAPERM